MITNINNSEIHFITSFLFMFLNISMLLLIISKIAYTKLLKLFLLFSFIVLSVISSLVKSSNVTSNILHRLNNLSISG